MNHHDVVVLPAKMAVIDSLKKHQIKTVTFTDQIE